MICHRGYSSANKITVVNATLKFGDKVLKYNKNKGKFVLTSEEGNQFEVAKLYRLDVTLDVINEADTFRTEHFSYIRNRVCDINGNTDTNSLQSSWFRYKYYEILSPTTQYYFTHLVYTHNAHPTDSNESVVDCYDYVLSKYENLNLQDYMFRKVVGTYQPSWHERTQNGLNILFNSNDKGITITIFVVASQLDCNTGIVTFLIVSNTI